MPKALLLDINGVLVQSPKLSTRFRETYGVPEAEFLPVLRSIMALVRQPGGRDSYQYWKPYLKRWKVDLDRTAFYAFCFESDRVDEEVVAVLREIQREGVRIYGVSNSYPERSRYYHAHFPVIGELTDKLYYSWQTGYVKPDPAVYRNVLGDRKLAAKDVVAVDDQEQNVAAAQSVGITAFLYETSDSLMRNVLRPTRAGS
ncbi:MAG: HAD-IA family hydrolase [Candidatus Kerfeldbacteria bacterium]|nr:HAD-IA family hydrolase [Candidatus Kerfeldbacteria bacterium]